MNFYNDKVINLFLKYFYFATIEPDSTYDCNHLLNLRVQFDQMRLNTSHCSAGWV